jgi:hypothetical protein
MRWLRRLVLWCRRLVPYEEVPVWRAAVTFCPFCGAEEYCVYPIEAEFLECGECGKESPAPALDREPAGRVLIERRGRRG